jgi:signal transduction histidine kinase
LDPAFDLNGVTGLGLSIVRTLVTTELNGSILIRAGVAEDFIAAGIADQRSGDGTVVQLSLPR